jgi:hypothetical protein
MQHLWVDTLFPTRDAMLTAIAEAWATAHGHASPEEVARTFAEVTDAELATEAIEGFGLRDGGDTLAADLADAFARVRAGGSLTAD